MILSKEEEKQNTTNYKRNLVGYSLMLIIYFWDLLMLGVKDHFFPRQSIKCIYIWTQKEFNWINGKLKWNTFFKILFREIKKISRNIKSMVVQVSIM